MRQIIIIIFLFILTGCETGNSQRESSFTEQDGYEWNTSYKTILYEVLPNDTITSIARKYSISAQQIITLNNLKKPYFLKSGQILKIPVTEYKKSNLMSEVDNLDKPRKSPKKEVYIIPRKK